MTSTVLRYKNCTYVTLSPETLIYVCISHFAIESFFNALNEYTTGHMIQDQRYHITFYFVTDKYGKID